MIQHTDRIDIHQNIIRTADEQNELTDGGNTHNISSIRCVLFIKTQLMNAHTIQPARMGGPDDPTP